MVSYAAITRELCEHYFEKHPDDIASAIAEVDEKLSCLLDKSMRRTVIASTIEGNNSTFSQFDISGIDWFVLFRGVKKCLLKKADGEPGKSGLFTLKRNRIQH